MSDPEDGRVRHSRAWWLVWIVAILAGGACYALLAVLAVPSPELFAALVTGVILALSLERPPQLGVAASRAAQAVVGATIGATITLSALARMARDWAPVLVVTVLTIALSLLCGWLLHRWGRVSVITGLLSMISGGASTITAVSRELGGDDRVVAVIQYMRVLLILGTLPLVVLLVFHVETAPAAGGQPTRLWSDLLFTVLSAGLALVVSRLIPASTTLLFGSMVIAAVVSIAGWLGPVRVPPPIVFVCFVALGLQVGLRFTRDSLRTIARLIPAAVALTIVVIVGSAGLGMALVWLTGIDYLTAYLATTPGGLPAVLAIAVSAQADPTYVFAMQLARLMLVLVIASLLPRLFGRRGDPVETPDGTAVDGRPGGTSQP